MNDGGNGRRRERSMKSMSNSGEEDEYEYLERKAERPKKAFKEDRKEMNTTNPIKFRIIRVDQDQRQCSADIMINSQISKENFLEPLYTSKEQGKTNFESQISDLVNKESEKEEVLKCDNKEGETMSESVRNGNIVKEVSIEVEIAEVSNVSGNDMQEDTTNIEASKLLEKTCASNSQELLLPKKRKKPVSKRNGEKQMLDKRAILENSIETKERAQVLNYMKEHKRPFSAQNVFDGLKGEVKKLNLQRILESLVKEGELISKDFSKLMIYMVHPNNIPTPPREEIERLDKEMADYQDKLSNTYNQVKENKESNFMILK